MADELPSETQRFAIAMQIVASWFHDAVRMLLLVCTRIALQVSGAYDHLIHIIMSFKIMYGLFAAQSMGGSWNTDMLKTSMASLKRFLSIFFQSAIFASIKRVVFVLIVKFLTTSGDIAKDLINGIGFIDGSFGLQLYYLIESKDVREWLYDQHICWGLLTLLLVWIPGMIKVAYLAKRRDWKTMTKCQKVYQIACYIVLIIVWPVFSALL